MREVETLAVHPGALGDCILFGRLLAALPGRVRFVGPGEVGRLLVGLGAVDEAVDFNTLPMHTLFAADAPMDALSSRLGPCRRLISCFPAETHDAGRRRLVAACGAREACFLPVRLPAGEGGHLVDGWLRRLGQAPGADAIARTTWPVPQAWQDEARQRLAAAGVTREVVLLHPGAGAREKCWPRLAYVDLARKLAARYDIVFVRGAVEQETQPRPDCGGGVVIESPPLHVLAGMQTIAKHYIGNDSGPSHLAAALGADTTVIFRATSGEQFRPLGPFVTVLNDSPEVPLVPELVKKECFNESRIL